MQFCAEVFPSTSWVTEICPLKDSSEKTRGNNISWVFACSKLSIALKWMIGWNIHFPSGRIFQMLLCSLILNIMEKSEANLIFSFINVFIPPLRPPLPQWLLKDFLCFKIIFHLQSLENLLWPFWVKICGTQHAISICKFKSSFIPVKFSWNISLRVCSLPLFTLSYFQVLLFCELHCLLLLSYL